MILDDRSACNARRSDFVSGSILTDLLVGICPSGNMTMRGHHFHACVPVGSIRQWIEEVVQLGAL